MHKEVALELNDETLLKLDKLAAEQGLTRDELINRSLAELVYETEPVDA
jgi:predicted transcriptional regulator